MTQSLTTNVEMSTTVKPASGDDDDEGPAFDEMSRVIQVSSSELVETFTTMFTHPGLQNSENYENLQVGPFLHRSPGHRPHHEEQLQGAESAAVVRRDGNVDIRQSVLFCREGGRRHKVHVYTGVNVVGHSDDDIGELVASWTTNSCNYNVHFV